MARGRMINSKITRNKAINDLSDDTSRLAYTWLITFADVDGRTHGDPALVRSLVFPRRTDITVERMESYIREWAGAGLVLWYEADGDMWIAFPTFAENQRGLDRRKEQPSEIPEPTDSVPGTYSVRTEYGLTEEKRREEKGNLKVDAVPQPEPAPEAPTALPPDDPVPTNRRSDPRSKHPAIIAVREAIGTRRYPPLEMYDGLISVLGENPDANRLRSCRQAWVERGYNPNAWTWASEWYAHGIPERGARASPSGALPAAAVEFLRRANGNGHG